MTDTASTAETGAGDHIISSSSSCPFLLLVEIRVPDALRHEFWTRWSVLQAHCAASEPNTTEYTLWESDKESGRILVLEKYTTKAAYLDVHRTSTPFADFKAWMQASGLAATVTGQSYTPFQLPA